MLLPFVFLTFLSFSNCLLVSILMISFCPHGGACACSWARALACSGLRMGCWGSAFVRQSCLFTDFWLCSCLRHWFVFQIVVVKLRAGWVILCHYFLILPQLIWMWLVFFVLRQHGHQKLSLIQIRLQPICCLYSSISISVWALLSPSLLEERSSSAPGWQPADLMIGC